MMVQARAFFPPGMCCLFYGSATVSLENMGLGDLNSCKHMHSLSLEFCCDWLFSTLQNTHNYIFLPCGFEILVHVSCQSLYFSVIFLPCLSIVCLSPDVIFMNISDTLEMYRYKLCSKKYTLLLCSKLYTG